MDRSTHKRFQVRSPFCLDCESYGPDLQESEFRLLEVCMHILPLAEVKAKLSQLVADVAATDEEVTITKNGHAAAVLVSYGEFEGWQETLAADLLGQNGFSSLLVLSGGMLGWTGAGLPVSHKA